MKQFLGEDFLLDTPAAIRLYDAVADLPIIDYHCHLSAQELYEDRLFRSLTDVWLGGDHYKWRLMRGAGVAERFITGDASDWEKFEQWAGVLQRAIGNPLYHWSHLELRRFFGIEDTITAASARSIFDRANELLARPDFSPRHLVRKSNVEIVCTTDDPLDPLTHHELLAADPSFETQVLPGFRPDAVLRIERDTFLPYIQRLAEATGHEIVTLDDLVAALGVRVQFFADHGCRVADHSLEVFPKTPATDAEAEAALVARLAGETLTPEQTGAFHWVLLTKLATLYHQQGWVMEWHLTALRDASRRFLDAIGPDTGFDAVGEDMPIYAVARMLSDLDAAGELPKTLLFTLDENANKQLAALATCFPAEGVKGNVQLGNAWWFNDTIAGMTDQIATFAEVGHLDAAVGMVTDSRSFLSYPRHEYFRRIVADLVGGWIESGLYPDEETAAAVLRGVFHDNAIDYFGFTEGPADE